MSLFAILLALVLVFIDGALSACSNGGSFTTFSSQSFTTDNYPGTYPYEPCEWSVTVPVGSVVLLSFDAFDLGTNFVGSCINDYIEVYDGDSATGTLLGQYCGTSLPPDLLTTSNIMTVKLTVGLSSAFNSFNTQTGFSAVFTASAAGLDSGCGNIGTYNGQSSGSFSTMNYGSGQYDNSATCTWEITVTSGMYVALSFSSFDVDTFTCAGNDKVTVYYGVGSGLSEEGSYCGTNSGIGSYPPATVYSCTNEMTVIFTSDSSGTNSGFLASFLESATGSACPTTTVAPTTVAPTTTTVAPTTTPAPTTIVTTLAPTTPISYSTSCTGTGSTMTSTTGTLQTMNYPSAYDSYSNCTWEIQVAAVSSVSLSFDNFRVGDPNDTNCTADYVAVYDGLSPNTVLMGTYCTWATPPNITVSSGELTIIFISDGVDNTQGFSATYTVTPTTPPPTTAPPTTTNPPTTAAPTTTAIPSTLAATTTTVATTTVAPTTTAAPTTAQPTTAAPTTVQPTTAAPTTVQPTTAAPTTVQPTTAAPTTAQPTTTAATTAQPSTVPTTTASPSTAATTTTQPSTAATTTASPSTTASTTAQPSTAPPTTVPPSTTALTTTQQSTLASTTTQASTAPPTTTPPSTAVPSTTQPSTLVTTTQQPSTAAPTTVPPSTSAPTTAQPSTVPSTTTQTLTTAPTTPQVTTAAPTTAQPTTTPVQTTPKATTVLTTAPTTPAVTTVPVTTTQLQTTPAPNTTCPDSGVLTDQYGSVSSMNYPFPYLNNAYCEWVIAVGAGLVIQLQFNAFVLEPSTADPNCTKDYVKVYQGTGSSKTLAGTYCGQSIPATFTSSGNTMSVSFTSDGSFTYQGFIAVYTAIQLTTQGTTTVTPATPWISFTESIIAVVFLCLLALLVIAMAAYCVYATCRKKPKVADGESNPLKANNQKANNGKNSDKGIELPPYNGTKPPKQAFGPNTAAAAGAVAGGAAVGGTAAAVAANSNAAGKKSILKNGGSGGSGQEAPVTASSKFAGPAAGAGGAAAGTGTGVAV
ncbi:mucin-5AC-like, partial [Branchiostoma floridae]|uniref:Mucin-5AC-like n=1 Tax=Branchiostoma floridae TaxID=7739 RepID=A0A9J7KJL6_BRAFL